MTNIPPELTPVVDAVVAHPAVVEAWKNDAPIEDLVAAVILLATEAIADRAIRRYQSACDVDWEYGRRHVDGHIRPYTPNYTTRRYPITHRRRHIRETWEPIPDGERAT